MIKIIFFIFLWQSSVFAALTPDSLNGHWESKYLEKTAFSWFSKTITVKSARAIFTYSHYESPTATTPFLVMTQEGKSEVKINSTNELAYDMKFQIDKSTLLVTKDLPALDKLKIRSCTKLNVVTDTFSKACGSFDWAKHKEKMFNFISMTPNIVLLGVPSDPKQSYFVTDMVPLVRKP